MLANEFRLVLPDWIGEEVDEARIYADDEERVDLAIRLANRNIDERSGGPFGAAIFSGDGKLVAVGVNRVLPHGCSAAHAEIVAFTLAQTRVQRARLNEDGNRYVLATSAQPCAMCYGASFWAGIDELLVGARSDDVMELSEFDEGPLPADWIGELARRGIALKRDILRERGRDVFVRYAKAGGDAY